MYMKKVTVMVGPREEGRGGERGEGGREGGRRGEGGKGRTDVGWNREGEREGDREGEREGYIVTQTPKNTCETVNSHIPKIGSSL